MNLLSVVGLAIAVAFIAVLLRRFHPEYAMAVSLAAGVLILILLIGQIAPLVTRLGDMLAATSAGEYGEVLFKGLGVCILTQLAVDACKDAGETAIAEKAALAGKVFLLLLSLPLFEQIAKTVTGLINGSTSA